MKRTTEQRTILVVEQDAAVREPLAHKLREEGYFVLTVADGALAVDVARHNPISLILLNWTLLPLSGRDICRELRAHAETADIPILMMVTDEREIEQLLSGEPLANDYIRKPLLWQELLACVEALLRSGRWSSKRPLANTLPRTETSDEGEHVFAVDDLRIDVNRHRVMRGNREIELHQARLFDLLVYLIRHRGLVLTREHLLRQVWGWEPNTSRTVDVHVRWLREKLEDDPAHPHFIETVRGVGYRFRE
jgi:DNA-binding response OmpR family regulator